MLRIEIVRELDLCVDETKREARLGIDAFDQVIEIAPPDRGKPGSLVARQRALAEKAHACTAQAGTAAKLITASVTRGQVHFSTEVTARSLGIASGQQRHAAQRVAVDHGDRSAVCNAV